MIIFGRAPSGEPDEPEEGTIRHPSGPGIDRYGGAPGIRVAGAIEAARTRPQSGTYDEIVARMAALMESLAGGLSLDKWSS